MTRCELDYFYLFFVTVVMGGDIKLSNFNLF